MTWSMDCVGWEVYEYYCNLNGEHIGICFWAQNKIECGQYNPCASVRPLVKDLAWGEVGAFRISYSNAGADWKDGGCRCQCRWIKSGDVASARGHIYCEIHCSSVFVCQLYDYIWKVKGQFLLQDTFLWCRHNFVSVSWGAQWRLAKYFALSCHSGSLNCAPVILYGLASLRMDPFGSYGATSNRLRILKVMTDSVSKLSFPYRPILK